MSTPTSKAAATLEDAWRAANAAPLARAATSRAAVEATSGGLLGARRSRWSRLVRVARDLAIGLTLIAALPLGVIGFGGRKLLMITAPVRERVTEVDRLRGLRAPIDASITPAEAGAALHRLRPTASSDGFVARPAPAPDAPWTSTRLSPSQFEGRQSRWWNGPNATQIVAAAAKGLPEADRTWLSQLAKAGLWRDFDEVTAAREVDVLGQSFVTPFAEDASPLRMPTAGYRETRTLAHAGVARAAHYVAIGDPARAEQVLRSVVSLGFILIDDGVGLLDALIGRLIVDVGRDGLQQLYGTGYRPEQRVHTVWTSTPMRQSRADERSVSVAQLQADAIAQLDNPSLPRTIRYNELLRLRFSGCGSVSTVLFGSSRDVEQAFARARSSLARNDAERAHIDLIDRSLEQGPTPAQRGLFPFTVLQGAAAITSVVTGNPRIENCMNAVLGMR